MSMARKCAMRGAGVRMWGVVGLVAASLLLALSGPRAAAQGTPMPSAGQAPPAAGQPSTTPPYINVVDLEINPADFRKFVPAIMQNGETAVKEEPGVIQFDIMAPKDEPNHVFLYEVYENEAAYKSHLQSAGFKKFQAATTGMVKNRKVMVMLPIAFNTKSSKP